MAAIAQTADMIEQTLCAIAREYDTPGRTRTLLAFDREHGQFLLLDEGWDGYRRIHQIWLHLELRDSIIYIHEDGTEEGVANRLMAAGQPRNTIVLAFQAPPLRAATGFAIA